jgi:peptidoglycan hydrolase-like protein with peptidoglycan-binding domain
VADLGNDPQIRKIMSAQASDTAWEEALSRIRSGDAKMTRRSVGERPIKSVQRLLNFLGYSTASRGGFSIDGDFGRGTNRGIAQFQFDHGLNKRVTREALTYDCTSPVSAGKNILAVPETRLDLKTAEALLGAAREAIDTGDVTCGNFTDALFHLNKSQAREQLECAEIARRYGPAADKAIGRVQEELGVRVVRNWVLAIIKTETGGIIKPRFEQHHLTKRARKKPDEPLAEIRYEALSFGLGQVMGFNYELVGAPSARAMLTSSTADQVLYVARYLAENSWCKPVIGRSRPTAADFAKVARGYNGPKYADHLYHEKIARWFREFSELH